MKEPHHRPSAAFDKARDQDDQIRQQRIAALTREQRQAGNAYRVEVNRATAKRGAQ